MSDEDKERWAKLLNNLPDMLPRDMWWLPRDGYRLTPWQQQRMTMPMESPDYWVGRDPGGEKHRSMEESIPIIQNYKITSTTMPVKNYENVLTQEIYDEMLKALRQHQEKTLNALINQDVMALAAQGMTPAEALKHIRENMRKEMDDDLDRQRSEWLERFDRYPSFYWNYSFGFGRYGK